MAQPISELRLASSSALVLCLRPRLPQAPLDPASEQEAREREGRERLAKEMLENGQARPEGGEQVDKARGIAAEGGATKEGWEKLDMARRTLEALEANLADLVMKREHREDVLEVGEE